MSKFKFKPSYIDFGFEPSTKTIRFIHEGSSITIVSYPYWMGQPEVEYTPYVSGAPLIGTITATVGYDVGARKSSGTIEVLCDAETFYIPVIYSYDSEHIPISSVVDSVIIGGGDSSYITARDRHRAVLAAKRWVQDHPLATGTHIRFAELVVEDGNKIYVPSDFMDYIALHSYTPDGYLLPLYVNNDMNTSSGYLLDSNSMYVLDSNGFAISTMGITDHPENESLTLPYSGLNEYGYDDYKGWSGIRKTYNIRSGILSQNGMYRYIPQDRCFIVSNVPTDNLVLQYISDPVLADKMKLEIGELSIHKAYQDALEAYIYYKLVQVNRNVPLYEKRRAATEYSLALKRSNKRKLKMSELIQIISGTNPI